MRTTGHPSSIRFVPFALATVLVSFACSPDGSTTAPPPQPPLRGDAVAGRLAFDLECSSCHADGDGIDLAFFAFPDSTIVRRAVAHVDTATAQDIVAHVATLRVLPTSRDFRLFQPGGGTTAGDALFAAELFGANRWPADLTAEELAAIDPLDVRIALEFPLWSFEFSNLDWMPERPIAAAILDYPTEIGVGRTLLDRYHATRSVDDLIRAVLALRIAERDPANPDAPCVMEPFDRFQPEECFEARRWIAVLVAEHMIRYRETEALNPILHDAWWDVGNAARRSRQTGNEIDNAILNWAQWMYVGWAFEPDRHASVYLGIALSALGLPRHATFHALRAMVVRGRNSQAPFMDVRTAARFSPDDWTYGAVDFGYRHLLDRLKAGVQFRFQETIDMAKDAVRDAYVIAARKVSHAEAAQLAILRDQILAALDQVPVIGDSRSRVPVVAALLDEG